MSFIVTLAVIIFTIAGALFGLRRGLKKSTISLASVICAVVIALLIAGPLTNLIISEKTVYSIASSLNMLDKLEELAQASPALAEFLYNFPRALFAPLIFLVLFYLTKLLFRIPSAIIGGAISNSSKGEEDDDKKLSEKKQKYFGIPLGAVQGFVAIMATVMVFAGFIGLADGFVTTVMEDDSAELAELRSKLVSVDKFVTEAQKDPIVGALSKKKSKDVQENLKETAEDHRNDLSADVSTQVGSYDYGNFVFNHLSKFKFKGESYILSDEVNAMTKTTVAVLPITKNKDISKYSEEEIKAIDKFVKEFGKSNVLKEVFADVISNGCKKWSAGEEFLHIPAPKLNENVDPLLLALFKSMTETTSQTIQVDMGTFVEILRVFDRHELFTMFAESDNFDKLMSNLDSTFVSELLTVVSDNERFTVIVPEVTNISIRFLALSLDIPGSSDEVYSAVMTDISSTVADALANGGLNEENIVKVSADIKKTFENNGIAVSDDVTNVVAESMIQVFEGKEGNVTKEEVESYFKDYSVIYDAVESEKNNQAKGESVVENLADSNNFAKDYYDLDSMNYSQKLEAIAAIGVLDYYRESFDLTEVDGGSVLPIGVTADEYVTYLIKIYNNVSANKSKLENLDSESVKNIISLKSSQDMNSTKLTAKDLFVESGKCELSEEDIKNIGDGFECISNFVESLNSVEGKVSIDNIGKLNIESAGKALDLFKNSSILHDNVDLIAGALITSVAGTDEDLTEVLKDGVSYESLMTTVKSTGNIIANINSNSATDEEKISSVNSLLENINEENADVLIAIVNKDFMLKQGIEEKYALASAKVFKEVLKQMTLIEPAEREFESAHIRLVFEVALNKGKKDIVGENAIFKDYNEIISMGVESKVVSNALAAVTTDEKENKVSDPLGVANNLTEDQKLKLDSELANYYNSNKDSMSDAELKVLESEIEAIRLMFDVK